MTGAKSVTFRAGVDGGELRGHVGGDGDPVLALHGGPGLSWGYLDDMVVELRRDFRVASYQQRGLAPSTTSGPFSVDQEVDDVCCVLDALGWERAWIAGHSWGGHLLLHVAVAHPERVLGGLPVDPLGAVGDGGAAAMGETLEARIALLGVSPLESDEAVSRLRRVWPGYFAVPATAPPMPEIASSKEASEGIYSDVMRSMPELAGRLRTCEVPVLFVAGELSPLPPHLASGETAALMPSASVEYVAGAGHFPWVERPGCVRDAMHRLVSGTLS